MCLTCVYHWELLTVFDGHAAGDFVTRLDAKARDCQGKEWHLMHFMMSWITADKFEPRTAEWHRWMWREVTWWAVTVLSNLLQLVAAAFCLSSQPEIGLRFTWPRNGDSIHDAFKEVRSVGGILLQAYLYVFIFLAIYVILNINIGIVEDAFHEAKGRYVHSHPSPEQELSESISERVRRAIEEESPELDTLELLHGRHVGAEHRSTEMTSSSFGSPEQNGSPLPSDRGRLTKSMSGKYISPRILESPNLQEALVSTFSDRARSVSLPAQHLEVSVPGPALVRPPRPITKAEEPVSGPEMEMRTVDPEVAMALQELHLAAGRLQSRLANPSGPLLASLEHLEEAINEASRLAQG
eukprot:g1923.t1